MNRIEHIVEPNEDGERLDRIFSCIQPDISRARVQRSIRAGNALVDGNVVTMPDFRPRKGQALCLDLQESTNRLKPETGEICIVYQDKDLLVCNKAAGLTVHPCPSCTEKTLVQRLLNHFPQMLHLDGERPGIVHRLDKDTSGLMVVALSEAARLALSNAFASREVEKEYLALVEGLAPEKGECCAPVGRHTSRKTQMAVVPETRGGKKAQTRWKRLWHTPDGSASLLSVRILTGRTHQIRVHMAHLGHPLLGDATYAPSSVRAKAPRQMLHAWRLRFVHPLTGEQLDFTIPPPDDFPKTILGISYKMQRIVITGNPGSGKSALREFMAKRQIPVFSADEDVAALYASGGEASAWLAEMRGGAALAPDGSVDKNALMKIMKSDGMLRSELECVVHGLVRRDLELFFENQEASGAVMAVAEVPLYFECGWDKSLTPPPVSIGVACPRETRWQRLAEHRKWNNKKMAVLESWQWPEERKLGACNLCVDNSGSRTEFEEQAQNLLKLLASRRSEAADALLKHLEKLWKNPPPLI